MKYKNVLINWSDKIYPIVHIVGEENITKRLDVGYSRNMLCTPIIAFVIKDISRITVEVSYLKSMGFFGTTRMEHNPFYYICLQALYSSDVQVSSGFNWQWCIRK